MGYQNCGSFETSSIVEQSSESLNKEGSQAPALLEKKFSPPSLSEKARYGSSLAAKGNVIVVGAPADINEILVDVGGVQTRESAENGSVLIYKNIGQNTWLNEAKIGYPGARRFEQNFGQSVALNGSLIVSGNSMGNEVFLIYKQNKSWSPIGVLNPPDGESVIHYGLHVAAEGSFVAVSAVDTMHATEGNYIPVVYIYREGSVFEFLQKIVLDEVPLPPETGLDPISNRLSLKIFENFLFVGSPASEVSGLQSSGLVQVYEYQNTQFSLKDTIENPTPVQGDQFGAALELNGSACLFVGAPGVKDAGVDQLSKGVVYKYRYSNSNWALSNEIQNNLESGYVIDERFGQSIAYSNNSLLVGGVGRMTEFDLGVEPIQVRRYKRDPVQTLFGQVVGFAGSSRIVSEPYDETAVYPEKGSIYLFVPSD